MAVCIIRHRPQAAKAGNTTMTNTDDDDLSATDVIRCVYLAQMDRQRGDHESGRHWQANNATPTTIGGNRR